MKVEVLSQKGPEMKFSIDGVKPSFASALRRIMISEIPTMAIEFVDFKRNDSALPDEVVANRMGMIPLTFDEKTYIMKKDCKCEGKGCSNCQVSLVLKKKGPA
ncbi:MAG: DNA-directed RNA polymerase subunit D, partial [Candidatus Aenigmarchaeota archaeon]|nr:DNA-directed RNA polymerase subunit D [Candidatus Aenigmarchaeota archaeon]